jgi:hypothetical protein
MLDIKIVLQISILGKRRMNKTEALMILNANIKQADKFCDEKSVLPISSILKKNKRLNPDLKI